MPISEVFNMDCMEYLNGCKDKKFKLACVDVPYGLGMSSNGFVGGAAKTKKFYGVKDWDNAPPKRNILKNL